MRRTNALGRRVCNTAMGLALVLAFLAGPVASAAPVSFKMNPHFHTLPPGADKFGNAHGDIAIGPDGKIYISIIDGAHPGIQVYDDKGHYLNNLPDAPTDLHGFIIAKAADNNSYIFAVRLMGQEIIQMTLDGRVVLRIPASAVPDTFKGKGWDGQLRLQMTNVVVAPNGDIYATDGYGADFIHRFTKDGTYMNSFGGREAPWNFKTCHKMVIDTRYNPVRLDCTDRAHDRIVQMDLEGRVLGILQPDLRKPAAMAIYNNELAVGELDGRVSILDRAGEIVARIGDNSNLDERGNNRTPPEKWLDDRFYSPHGIVYDSAGNLLVTEYSRWGRVIRLQRVAPRAK